MTKVLDNMNIIACKTCENIIEFTKDDVKNGQKEYLVYGCELNYENYKFIICPNCKQEIELLKNKKYNFYK